MRALTATFRYVLLTALRDRFLGAIGLALVALLGIVKLLSSTAVSEGMAMGLALGGEAMRSLLVLGLIAFIAFHIRRMEESREIEAILARPIPRPLFVLAYFAAYCGIATLLAGLFLPLLAIAFEPSWGGLLEWDASLILEGWIVVALALFCALSLESATAALLAALGLYGLARMAAYFRAIADNQTAPLGSDSANRIAHAVIAAVTAVMPRLDLFGQSRWLVYGPGGEWGLGRLLLQTAVILPLLLLATIRDVQIKRY